MNKKTATILEFCVVLVLTISCASGDKEADKRTGHNMTGEKNENPVPEIHFSNYNEVLKLHKNIVKDFSWPLKHEVDLNCDGVSEEFLAVEGYSRGMSYVLFHRQNQIWKLISGNGTIPSGHLGIVKLKNKKNGWHDFNALQSSGRGGIIESCFTWNGQKYILKNQKEVQSGK